MAEVNNSKQKQPVRKIEKRIGNTTYKVNIRFNPKSKESMADKMKRVIINQMNN